VGKELKASQFVAVAPFSLLMLRDLLEQVGFGGLPIQMPTQNTPRSRIERVESGCDTTGNEQFRG
jgi:hypothetical protein